MKKHYDISRITDELSKSVFFQKSDQNKQPAPQQDQSENERNQIAFAPSQQSDLALKHQNTDELKIQSTKALKNLSTKAPNKQSDKDTKHQSTLALKHFSSYLQPGTYKAWKLLATQREMKDYEILQEAVEQYLEREQAK